eukprot:576426-Amphidinium_carterae.1
MAASWEGVAAYRTGDVNPIAAASVSGLGWSELDGHLQHRNADQVAGSDAGWGQVAAAIQHFEVNHPSGEGCLDEDQSGGDVPDLLAMPAQRRKRGRPKKSQELASVGVHVPAPPNMSAHIPDESAFLLRSMICEMIAPLAMDAQCQLMTSSGAHPLICSHSPYVKVSDLMVVLQNCVVESCKEGATLDADVVKLYDRYLCNPDFHLMSVVATADLLKMSRKVVEHKLCRLAAGIHLHELTARLCMEASLSKLLTPTHGLRVYVDYCSYDETPMRASLRSERLGLKGKDMDTTSGGIQLDCAYSQKLETSMSTTSVTLKILQSLQCLVLLLRFGETYVKVQISMSSPLECLQRTTASVMQQALLQINGCSHFNMDYALRTRCACTDQASSNLKAERCLSHLRGFQGLLTKCDIHSTAKSHTKTYGALMAPHIHGILHVALALQDAGGLALFRTCLKQEVSNRLSILQGTVPTSAKAFKVRALNLFLGADTTKSVTQRIILSRLPNGDWCNTSQVEVYVKVDPASVDKEALADSLEAGLVYAMVGSKPVPWAEHRWCSSHRAIEQIGLLLAVHGLLRPTFQRFCMASSKPGRPLGHSAGTSGSSAIASLATIADDDLQQAQALGDEAEPDVAAVTSASLGLECMGNESAEEHALHRSAG